MRIVSRDLMQQDRGVTGVTRERANLIQRRREGDHPEARDAPIGGFESDGVGQRAGLADRAAGIRAERAHRLAHRHGCRRSAAAAAGHAREIPRIVRRAIRRILGARSHGEFIHVELAQRDRARREQAFHHRRGVRRDESRQDARSGGCFHAFGIQHVFQRQGNAGQRREGALFRQAPIGRARLGQRLFFGHAQEGVHVAVHGANAIEMGGGQLDRRDLFGAELFPRLGDGPAPWLMRGRR